MPRWTAADDAAVLAAHAARQRPGTGSAWPDVHCPDRGTITGAQARYRCARINRRAAAPTPARVMRSTPVKLRATNAGVDVRPTPPGVRDVIADKAAPAPAVAAAQRELHKHQQALHKTVMRAEKRKPAQERHAELRKELMNDHDEWAKANSSDCPGLQYEEHMMGRLALCQAAAEAHQERSLVVRRSVGSSLWLETRKKEWRAKRSTRKRARETDAFAQQLAARHRDAPPPPPAAPLPAAPSWDLNDNNVARSHRFGDELHCPGRRCRRCYHDWRRYLQVSFFEEAVRDFTEKEGNESAAIARIRSQIEIYRPGFLKYGDWGRWPSFAGHVDELIENHDENRLFFPPHTHPPKEDYIQLRDKRGRGCCPIGMSFCRNLRRKCTSTLPCTKCRGLRGGRLSFGRLVN